MNFTSDYFKAMANHYKLTFENSVTGFKKAKFLLQSGTGWDNMEFYSRLNKVDLNIKQMSANKRHINQHKKAIERTFTMASGTGNLSQLTSGLQVQSQLQKIKEDLNQVSSGQGIGLVKKQESIVLNQVQNGIDQFDDVSDSEVSAKYDNFDMDQAEEIIQNLIGADVSIPHFYTSLSNTLSLCYPYSQL